MKTTTRKHRIAALLSVVGALLILGGTAQAATSKPAGMSNAEYQALMIRSQALNDTYGLGWPARKSELMTAAEFRALMLRSEALNQEHGLGEQKAAAVTSQLTNSTPAFAWGAFVIGAAAMFGLALLAGGFFVLHRLLATRRGLTPYGTA